MKEKNKILYLSYDGFLENISKSQILPYLKYFSSIYEMHTLSFEKNDCDKAELYLLKENFKFLNIHCKILYYSKFRNKYMMVVNLIKGIFNTSTILLMNKYSIIHIRSLMPCVFLFPFLFLINSKIIFDMRGFWIDEKVDRQGLKFNSYIYKIFKKFEIYFLKKSNFIICLTEHSKEILISEYNINSNKIDVIPTCVDTQQFKYIEKKNDKKNIKVISYIGSTSGAYLINKILFTFKELLNVNSNYKLNIYTKDNHANLLKLFESNNIDRSNYDIKDIKHENLQIELQNTDIGIFYLNKNFSISASFPTKIGEFFSMGIPIICNDFNNDIVRIFNEFKIGKIYDFENAKGYSIDNTIKEILNDKEIKKKCIVYAKRRLSIEFGLRKYSNVYDQLINE